MAITTEIMEPIVRERWLMDPEWRFHLGDVDETVHLHDDPHMAMYLHVKTGFAQGAASSKFNDTDWRTVDLPHDWSVEGIFDPGHNMDHGFLPAGIGWYRKVFEVPATDLGKCIYLELDGVFRNCTIWLNGHQLGTHASGYTSFRYEINDLLNYGDRNVVAVRVDATEFEGWWYEGAGIYRHVWLVKTDPLHIAPWGTFVNCKPTSQEMSRPWDICIQTTLINKRDCNAQCLIRSSIIDADGQTLAIATTPAQLGAGTQADYTQHVALHRPNLWSVESPHLYRVWTTITDTSGVSIDSDQTTFGIRSINFDAATGFYLNGEPLKLKGTCNHQDHAGVGVALPDRLQEFRIERLKEMGCNAYRCAHNPPAPEILDACDRLGMLVMDETRRMDSTPDGLAQLESIVLRDRNHPSIILWSLGNEEPIQGTDIGGRIIATMKRLVQRLDPTRPVTLAMNGAWGEGASQVVDVQGCNYFIRDYDDFHERFPHQAMVAAENGSTICTRGVYANDPALGYVSAYDLNHPDWAFVASDSWKAVAERPFVAGSFVWTGYDYRGEPTPYRWPCIHSHFGIMDTCGFPKDNFYYYQSWWRDEDTLSYLPVLHILPHWNWTGREGESIPVWCHSNCDAVELFLNGVSLGVKNMPRYGHLEWTVAYTPGALVARGYKAGREVVSAESKTTGAPDRITMSADRTMLHADGEDMAVITVAIADNDGLIVPTADNMVQFSVSSNARILGVGNGDPSCHEPDKAMQRSAFNGLCQVIVQSSRSDGDITLTAESDELQPARLVISTRQGNPRPYIPAY